MCTIKQENICAPGIWHCKQAPPILGWCHMQSPGRQLIFCTAAARAFAVRAARRVDRSGDALHSCVVSSPQCLFCCSLLFQITFKAVLLPVFFFAFTRPYFLWADLLMKQSCNLILVAYARPCTGIFKATQGLEHIGVMYRAGILRRRERLPIISKPGVYS